MNDIEVNQLLEYPADGLVERVLWIDPANRGLYAIDIHAARALPVFRIMEDMERLREAGVWRHAASDPWLRPVVEDAIPASHRAKRNRGWLMIKPLISDQPAIFDEIKRGRAITKAMASTGATNQTLYRLLRRYWQRGLTPNALLPDYGNCGGRGKDKAVSAKKRGRSQVGGEEEGINITPEIRSMFRAVITRRFATRQQMDLRDAWQEVMRAHFSRRAIDEHTGQQVLVVDKGAPTLRQFRYWFERDNDVFKVERTRRSPRVYDKDMRAILGSSTAETIGPGSRYQIDATIADVYLISRYDRSKIVGRPVLYVVVDVFSRMIAGVYVGFEGPSWVGAMMALANAASDKVAYCKQFSLDIGDADWPCKVLPDVLLGDRGEIAGGMIETLINNFQVHVENAAPYRADWKGIVEQRFRLLPSRFKAYVPGYVGDDFRARGGTDYRLDAVLDIDQFTRIILHSVLYYNTRHLIRDYEKPPQMIADQVKAIPIDLWEWGIAHRSGRLRSFPAELVRLSLLPSAEATVTAAGIRYAGCYYSCPKALSEHWFERARQKGTWKVRISYEPRSMDEVYLHDEAVRLDFIPCALTDKSRHHRGRTLWEIDQIRKDERRQDARHEPEALQAQVNLTDSIKAIIGEAEAMRPEPTGESKSRRVKNLRENRRAEREDERAREAFRSPTPALDKKAGRGEVLPFRTGKPPEDYSLPDITEFLRSFEKGESGDEP
ncbi:Mu transposase C-terminal domain-containing protein [Rhodomicrobium sp. Az07]|uniref:Mu transposase C-terminal domain-containing protein n=1 Tax=Rhodomicrobium sp. Az07 TaxID=2839034 RepID=UPI001BECE2F5|nr:Mu transposase C-terminal domain-containing protein [Rhodomicrobium sp. Az07]MBT3069572.1 Mu transposase C-terminal domain-containing protein [Rhodomicrobium sp. Az07]